MTKKLLVFCLAVLTMLTSALFTLADGDTTAPQISIKVISPADSTSSQTVNITCFDEFGGSGCDHILYCINNDGTCVPSQVLTDTITVDNGSNKFLRVLGEDNNGNKSESIGVIIRRLY